MNTLADATGKIRTCKSEHSSGDYALEMFLRTRGRNGEITIDDLIDEAMRDFMKSETDQTLRNTVVHIIHEGYYLQYDEEFCGFVMDTAMPCLILSPAGVIKVENAKHLREEVSFAVDTMQDAIWVIDSAHYLVGYFNALRKLSEDGVVSINMLDEDFKIMLFATNKFAEAVKTLAEDSDRH